MAATHEQRESRFARKRPRTMRCPVCDGDGVIRLSPAEASPWSEPPVDAPANPIEFVVERCWACDGKARLPVVDVTAGSSLAAS